MAVSSEERITSSFASCSFSSFATPQWEYDVFLSFRGKDTRKNFTDHLYIALKQKGINTFRDDERLERGKSISPELLKAIEESRFAIIVLSRNYASSTWCLEELAKIVECMKERGMTVWPIFHHVDPSDVRNQTGPFAEAFAERKICSMEKEQTWRAALREVGSLAGWPLGERHESEFIRQIVEKIFLNLHDKIPKATKGLVGIDNQVEELNCLLCVGSNDVRVIGIWGMGGIGKTTLAEVVFNIFFGDFEACSFIKSIKDVSKVSDFIQLQKQLLYEILKEENICLWTVESGVNVIKSRLHSKKILPVLDDVNDIDQLKYLAKERDWFGSGSRIIITTRDQHLLNTYGVDGIHKCKELNFDDSLKLFCLKAFKKEQPEEGYLEISRKIVDYANGLPLALDVLGSFLVERGINCWKDALKRLKEYPNAKIFGKLEISYYGLDDPEQRIFIYISCFLKGKNQGLVTDILESLDLCPNIGMDVLIKRSLISISKNIVWVHDLLQDMVWEILRKQSLAELGNRIGLKFRKDIIDVLTNNEGTKAIEIINQEQSMKEVEEVANCTCKSFLKMRKLRFLRIHNVYFPQGIEYLSNELRILEWYEYPLKSLPLGFQPKEIRELHMRYSQIENLWEGAMVFPNLRSIDLSHSKNLTQTPNLTETTRLETLDFHGCTNLVEGHPSILVHKRLNYLNLACCTSLENLPSKIEMQSLETLIFSNCSNVKRIPEFGENMKCLKELYLDGTAIEEIPPSIKLLIGLKELDFSRCSKLGNLPRKLGEIVCLENLDASKTAITEMHSSIAPMISLRSLEHLCCLTQLNLSWCNLFSIPNSIGSLSSLCDLCLEGNDFVTLPASISQLSKLVDLNLSFCERLQSLSELSFNNMDSLSLSAHSCTSLETLPQFLQISELDEQRKCFYYLWCSHCPKLMANNNSVAIVKRHLQAPYGRKVPFFTTNFGWKIPQWFTHQGEGKYVSVELPPNLCESTWMGFALCASFSLCEIPYFDFDEIKVSVFATTLSQDSYQCICPPKALLLTVILDSQAIWYVPKDTKTLKLFKHINCNQCSGHIIFYFEVECMVEYHMECGVRLVYKKDVEELKMIQTTSQASGSSIPPSVTGATTS